MHLAPGIIDVVFPLHLETDEFQQVGEGRPVGGAAPVPDMQRAGWIGGNEFDLDLLPLPLLTCAKTVALLEYALNHGMTGRAANEEIDESRTGHLDSVDAVLCRQPGNDGLGQHARRHAGRFRQGQGNIRGEVTLARILRRRNLDIDVEIGRKLRILLQPVQGLHDQIVDDLLQELKTRIRVAKMNRDFTRASAPLPLIFCTLLAGIICQRRETG